MKYYDSISNGYNELHREEQLKKLELIKKHVDFTGLVLDIGAGTGISSEFWKNAKVISLEPSLQMLKQSKCEKVQAKAEELPFKDETFDEIISLTALHHADLKKALDESLANQEDDFETSDAGQDSENKKEEIIEKEAGFIYLWPYFR